MCSQFKLVQLIDIIFERSLSAIAGNCVNRHDFCVVRKRDAVRLGFQRIVEFITDAAAAEWAGINEVCIRSTKRCTACHYQRIHASVTFRIVQQDNKNVQCLDSAARVQSFLTDGITKSLDFDNVGGKRAVIGKRN
jgi:hypothetical protein